MPITKLVAVPVSTARSFALAGTQVRSVEIAGGYDEIEAVTRRQATSDNGPVDRRTTLAQRGLNRHRRGGLAGRSLPGVTAQTC